MSTKTSIKRIALVAVSALGFGLLSVVPAKAEFGVAAISGIVVSAEAGQSFATGEAQEVGVVVTAGATLQSDTLTLKARASAFPNTVNSVSLDATDIDGAAAANWATGLTNDNTSLVTISVVAGATGVPTGTKVAKVKFTPNVAGSYTLTVWHDADGDGTINGSEKSGTSTLTITASGAKTQAAISTADGSDRVSTVAVASTQNSARAGVLTTVTPNFKLTADSTAGGLVAGDFAVTLAYALSKPATSATTLSSSSQTKTTSTAVAQPAADAEQAKEDMNAITFTPDVAGTYTVTAWHDADGDNQVDNGEASGSLAIIVAADAPVLTLKAYNATAATGDWDTNIRGSLVQLTLTNGGVAASLSGTERIRVSVDSGQIELESTATASTSELNLTTLDITRDDLDSKGRVWLNFSRSTDGAQVVTFDGIGGGVDSILQTLTITYKTAAGEIDKHAVANTTGVVATEPATLNGGGANGAYATDPLVATSVKVTASATTAAATVAVHLKDVSGLITGLANLEYSTYVSGATLAADDFSVTLPAFGAGLTVNTNNYEFTIGDVIADDKVVVTATDATVNVAGDVTLDQNSSIRAKKGSSITLSAVFKNQYGVVAPNRAVVVSVASGRNTQVTALNAVTNADGRVSFTYSDAPLTATSVLSTDTVTFDGPGGANKNYTITWVDAIGVTKVVAYGGNTASTGVTSTTLSEKDISAADGAEAGAQPIYAKVTDVNGSILVGVPVTFSVAGSGAEIATDKVIAYTDATGLATSSIYGWISGTYTYTATADGVSGTGTITFAQTNTGEERTLSATVSGAVITAKVVDRFGNPVRNVKVWATKTGAGYFGTGLNSTSADTNTAGIAEFVIAGGDAEVTLYTYDPTSINAKGSGQTCAAAGNADCATTPTKFTAYTAGTAVEGSEGVGASFSAAGVSMVKVSATGVNTAAEAAAAAADAAAEAIDAANAATDAANLAAEAADAATVAAEEARDAADAATAAVEELATQVATLMAALKAQITTLANTVAKIAKKVRA